MPFFLYNKKISRILGTVLCLCILAMPFSFDLSIQKADAQLGLGGKLVKDVQNTFTNTLQTIAAQTLAQKDLVLDPMFFQIAQQALQQMTKDILTFINSGNTADENGDGQPDNSPMFVTNMSDHFENLDDKTAKAFTEGDALSLICDDFEVDIRIALQIHYQLSKPEGFKDKVSCGINTEGESVAAYLEGSFKNGDWSAWFQTITHPEKNTPVGAYVAAKQELSRRNISAQTLEKQELTGNNNFLSTKACDDSTGKCSITTPGILIQGQASAALSIPMLSLLNADEFNETIGNLFGNLANEVFSGANGLLGLSDSSSGSSYFDKIEKESDNAVTFQTSNNPISEALANETRVLKAELAIVDAIASITRCNPEVVLPPLSNWEAMQSEYTTLAITTSNAIARANGLADMSATYASSTSITQQGALISQLEQMRTNGELLGLPYAIQFEQTLYALQSDIATWEAQIGYVAGPVDAVGNCLNATSTSTPTS